VRRYVRRTTLFARQLVGDADDAEDIAAEAFVIAIERAMTFREGGSVGPWLYGGRRAPWPPIRRSSRRLTMPSTVQRRL
jgi:DNA-directed RNA polymerase specialized sigma24 family protein